MSYPTQYEPESPAHNSALAIYQKSSSADAVINASPLDFEMEIGKAGSTSLQSTASTSSHADQVEEQQEPYISGTDASSPEEYDDIDDELQTDSNHSNRETKMISEAVAFQGLGGSKKWGNALPATRMTDDNSPNTSSISTQRSQFTPNAEANYSPGMVTNIPIPRRSKDTIEPTEPEFRRFQLRISRSHRNHRDYIERQGYYGAFNPNKLTIMAEDLQGRVPVEAMIDCQLSKPEVPLWVKNMKNDRVTRKRLSLRQLWEEGKQAREM